MMTDRSRGSRWAAPFLFVLACASLSRPVSGGERIATRQELFYIPFSVQAADGPSSPPTEVVLYVSGDRGGHWEIYQTQAPETGRFSFHAGSDGEYWFAVRTRFVQDAAAESKPSVPELTVVVDRQQPQVELNAELDPTGQLVARWSVLDPELDMGSFRLEFRPAGSDNYMAVRGADGNLVQTGPQGQFIWPIPPGTPACQVRVTVADRAGNISVVERDAVPAAPNGPSAIGTPPVPSSKAMSSTQTTPGGNPATASNESLVSLPNGGASSSPFAPRSETSAGPQAWPTEHVATPSTVPPGYTVPPSFAGDSSTTTSPAVSAPDGSLSVPPTLPADASAATGWQPGNGFNMTTGPAQQVMSRSRKFQLEYDVEPGEYGGLHRIEIWYTADNGLSWRHYGDDPDLKSPFVADVPADGVYGFRLLPQAREGLTVQPPKGGDPADVWVTVDSTLPAVKLTGTRLGRGNEVGQMRITWEATDGHLSDRPISLLFSESIEGPWRQIATQLPNTGVFAWKVDDRVPPKVFVRIEVVDQAGNVGIDVTRDPVRSDGLSPQGLIRSVRPVQFRAFSPN